MTDGDGICTYLDKERNITQMDPHGSSPCDVAFFQDIIFLNSDLHLDVNNSNNKNETNSTVTKGNNNCSLWP